MYNMDNKKNTGRGIGTLGVVEIVFIILKLTNVINWPWWKVLIPFYIEVAILVSFFLLMLGCYLSVKIKGGK